MLNVSGLTPPNNAADQYWSAYLPAAATDKLLASKSEEFLFDEIIIDEAQDILTHSLYLDFLDISLRGGLTSGRWRLFGDFERQAIYGAEGFNWKEIIRTRTGSVPLYSLRVNCRNTPRIAALVRLLAELDPNYSRVRRPDNGWEPNIRLYKNKSHQIELLAHTLRVLEADGYSDDSVVILSPYTDPMCAAAGLGIAWQSKLTALSSQSSSGKMRFGTVHSFKGMEAPAVVVTDIDGIGRSHAMSLFYVAITRAVERLVILVGENARQEILGSLAQTN